MDPEQTPQSNSPTAPATPPEPQSLPPKNQKKKWLIIGLIVFAVIVIVMMLLNPNKSSDNSSGPDAAFYYDRPGYNPKDYQPGIGDPMALTMKDTKPPVSTSAGHVVFACNVLPLDTLSSSGILPRVNSLPTPVQRTHNDGVGKADPEPELYTLPTEGNDSNDCSYAIQGTGRISIEVYQPPMVAAQIIDKEIERGYSPVEDVAGLKVYKENKSDKDTDEYLMRSKNDTLRVYLVLGDKRDKAPALLQTIAKNFVNLQQNPKGTPIAKYSSPTFKKSVALACDYVNNDDIVGLTGNNASKLVHEGYATGTGIAEENETLYNYIQTTCERRNTGLGSGLTDGPFDQQLDMTIWSFQEDNGAKLIFKDAIRDAKEPTKMSAGEEAYCYRDTAGQNTVVVRQGRYVFEMVLNRTLQKNNGLDTVTAMAQKMTPFAQQTAAKLSKQQ